jgi:hypothetical protein
MKYKENSMQKCDIVVRNLRIFFVPISMKKGCKLQPLGIT